MIPADCSGEVHFHTDVSLSLDRQGLGEGIDQLVTFPSEVSPPGMDILEFDFQL